MPEADRGVIASMESQEHELVVHGHDRSTGLRAIVAIHSTALGPALGGTRFLDYPSEQAALNDVLRLSEGMSLKSAAAGLSLGGGKAVIIGEPQHVKTSRLLEAYGRMVDDLAGKYITAEDVGTTVDDMVTIAEQTRWVTGLPKQYGGSGDPSPMTARGVVAAMKAAAAHLWDEDALAGRRVAIQGAGKVGSALAESLHELDAELVVSDKDSTKVEEVRALTGAKVVDPDEILFAPCDILAPCALGAVLTRETIPELQCDAIVGSANNQLATYAEAGLLAERGILYAPDFMANAGGVVNISVELAPSGYSDEEASRRVDGIFDQMALVLEKAARDGLRPLDSALRLARERLGEAAEHDGAA